jgi:hypothetical protein
MEKIRGEEEDCPRITRMKRIGKKKRGRDESPSDDTDREKRKRERPRNTRNSTKKSHSV